MNIKLECGNKTTRCILIPKIEDFSAMISSKPIFQNSVAIEQTSPAYYVTPSPAYNCRQDDTVFNFPFLFDNDGQPWREANLHLYSLCEKSYVRKSTKNVRKKASHLLDYKIWLEENGRSIFDLEGRPTQRVTYAYFLHLIHLNISPGNTNSRTKSIYDFYGFLANQPGVELDMARVDQTKEITLLLKNNNGVNFRKNVVKRSQTLKVPSYGNQEIGLVVDEGEKLRPLYDSELDSFLETMDIDDFQVDERLIVKLALETGARKQSIFTLRMKHIKDFKASTIKNKCYELHIGPGTGIDTKYDRKHKLDIPTYLVEELILYANSKVAKARRAKYKKHSQNTFENLDIYLFLSERGQPHYIAKNDPRHMVDRSPAIGGKANQIVKKVLKHAAAGTISVDIVFHWLRATSAFLYYQTLIPLLAQKLIVPGQEISMVQRKMGHVNRKTTELYLKLFSNTSEQKYAQRIYEEAMTESLLTGRKATCH